MSSAVHQQYMRYVEELEGLPRVLVQSPEHWADVPCSPLRYNCPSCELRRKKWERGGGQNEGNIIPASTPNIEWPAPERAQGPIKLARAQVGPGPKWAQGPSGPGQRKGNLEPSDS